MLVMRRLSKIVRLCAPSILFLHFVSVCLPKLTMHCIKICICFFGFFTCYGNILMATFDFSLGKRNNRV